jgi:single-stranded-DNA-specific exonuclease
MNLIAKEQLQDLVLQPVIMADIEITLAELTPNLYQYLEWLQPTGYGNPAPIFKSQNVQVKKSQAVGRDQTHLKLTLTDGWITFDAIAFRQGYWKQNLPKYIDIMYNFEKNDFRGRENFQLNIKDIKKAGETL